MHELTKHIKFYIHYKIHTDPSWRNVNVIFSGHEVRSLSLSRCSPLLGT